MYFDIIYGFLGSGKTTFVANMLQEWGGQEKIAVLVNEFGEVGIDGSILSEAKGPVVEMPSGCICCTLMADFQKQMLDIAENYAPDRVIIEPTGVATISQVLRIIGSQFFEKIIDRINRVMISDTIMFLEMYRQNRHFMESQVKGAQLVLLNKCDLVQPQQADLILSAIQAIEPDLTIIKTEYGRVDWHEYSAALAVAADPEPTAVLKVFPNPTPLHGHDHDHDHEHHEHHHHSFEDGLCYESFGLILEDMRFKRAGLEVFFNLLRDEKAYGNDIVRAKGLFQLDEGAWILMELASGQVSFQPINYTPPGKFTVIGKDLQREYITDALKSCSGEVTLVGA
jgi:G3E family GTPase